MTTTDIVNMFICTRAYGSCLEIGLRGTRAVDANCARRLRIESAGREKETEPVSDAFFARNKEKFDVVVVDGVHRCGQVLRDIDNALAALNPGGVVVVRNCLPTTEQMASPTPQRGSWCGDVYRAAAWYFSRSPYLCYTVDADFGCGVIDTARKVDQQPALWYSSPEALSYAEFVQRRAGLLHVVGSGDLPALVGSTLVRRTYPGVRPMYVITPTGDRPEAFALCVDYVNRQTRKPDMWLIVDDGRSDAVESQLGRVEVPYRVIRLPPKDGENTLLRNLGAALDLVPDSACVCVMEDDDWYPANYLETVYPLLLTHDFVSIRECHYYHVPTRQYRLMHGTPTNGDGWSGPALTAIRSWVASGIAPLFDNRFGRYWCGTSARHGAIPGHTVGFGTGRAGVTSSHRIEADEEGWNPDPDGAQLVAWVGADASRYIELGVDPKPCGVDPKPCGVPQECGAAPECGVQQTCGGAQAAGNKVYIISNVDYRPEDRLVVDKDDLLVFLNTARSLDYYDDHENKVVYHRSPEESYGKEFLCVKNRYVFDAGALGIPSDFIRTLKSEYDWDYPIETGKVRSATTGYMVAKYMEHLYPGSEIVLVNFGYTVAKSTYRCPWHNWRFEAHALAKFRHIFTTKVRQDVDPLPEYKTKERTPDERRVALAFTQAGSDRMTSHDYTSVFTSQILRLSGRPSRIAEIGGLHGSGVKAFMELLPTASVYGVGVSRDALVDGAGNIFGDGYASETWDRLPTDFDLIVDDGSHRLADMLRGLPTFLAHLKPGGVLLVEDIKSDADVEELMRRLPGAVYHRTPPISSHDDDRVVEYVKPSVA